MGVTLHIDSWQPFFRVDPDIFKKLQNISWLVIFAMLRHGATFFPLIRGWTVMRILRNALRINEFRPL
jgi:hypothetical protein